MGKKAPSQDCPKCEAPTRRIWVKNRMLQQECRECGWEGKPFVPPRQAVRSTRSVGTGNGWCYETFDQYGHTTCFSEAFGTKAQATREARKDVKSTSAIPGYGRCTAIVWPPSAVLRGTRIR